MDELLGNIAMMAQSPHIATMQRALQSVAEARFLQILQLVVSLLEMEKLSQWDGMTIWAIYMLSKLPLQMQNR